MVFFPFLRDFLTRAKIIPAWATILAILFWDLSMFYQIFFSPQVKRSVIISNKHGIIDLPCKLPNDLRLRLLPLSPLGGLSCPQKEKKTWTPGHGIPPMRGLLHPHQKKTQNPGKLGNIPKISKYHRIIAPRPDSPQMKMLSTLAQIPLKMEHFS